MHREVFFSGAIRTDGVRTIVIVECLGCVTVVRCQIDRIAAVSM